MAIFSIFGFLPTPTTEALQVPSLNALRHTVITVDEEVSPMADTPSSEILDIKTSTVSTDIPSRQITLPAAMWQKVAFVDKDKNLNDSYHLRWYLDENKDCLIASDRRLEEVFNVQPIKDAKLSGVEPGSEEDSNSSSCRVHISKFDHQAPKLFSNLMEENDGKIVITLQKHKSADYLHHFLILFDVNKVESMLRL